jgi:hypothetical protein
MQRIVYVLESGMDYEGSEIHGVNEIFEESLARAERVVESHNFCLSFELGARHITQAEHKGNGEVIATWVGKYNSWVTIRAFTLD